MGSIKVSVYRGDTIVSELNFKDTPTGQKMATRYCQERKKEYLAHPYWKGYAAVTNAKKLSRQAELKRAHEAYCATNNITRPAPLRVEITHE